MQLKTFLCIMVVVCIIPAFALAAEKKDTSKSAMKDLKEISRPCQIHPEVLILTKIGRSGNAFPLECNF